MNTQPESETPTGWHIQVLDKQPHLKVDLHLLAQAVRTVLADHGIQRAQVRVVLVDDATIWDLNRRFLQHDWPTDVITFPLETSPEALEAEVVISTQTAIRQAQEYGTPPEQEVLLYAIHGALHLVGYDDTTGSQRQRMRCKEQEYLCRFASGKGTSCAGKNES